MARRLPTLPNRRWRFRISTPCSRGSPIPRAFASSTSSPPANSACATWSTCCACRSRPFAALAYLRRMGLVENTREGKFAHYRLADAENAVHRHLIDCARSCFVGVPALDRERRQPTSARWRAPWSRADALRAHLGHPRQPAGAGRGARRHRDARRGGDAPPGRPGGLLEFAQ